MKMRAVVVAVMWAGGCVAALGQGTGQAGAKADSSAALRNDKPGVLGNDKPRVLGNDEPGALRNDKPGLLGNDEPGALRNDQQKRPMTFADLMAMKRVSDPQISPSGKWVMFSVMDVDLGKNTKTTHLWVVGLGGGGATEVDSSASLRNDKRERQLTVGTANETGGRFSPDGKWVLYTSDVGGKSQLWLAPWDESKGELGSPRSPLTAVSTEADGGVWSPDSRRVMFVSSVWPECSVKGGMDSVDPTHPTTASKDHWPGTSDRDKAAMNGAPGGGGGTKATTEILTGGQNDASIGEGGASIGGGGTSIGGGGAGKADSSASLRNDTPLGVVVGGTLAVDWMGREPATWAAEEACDTAKDEAVAKTPVKGQVWEGLLYRHWDHFTGAKRSHVLVVDVSDGLHVGANVRDLTPASVVGDAETPTFSLGGPLGYAWAPDSKEIAYVTNLDAVPAASTNNDVFTLRLDEPGAKAVKVSTSPGSDDEPEYSPDGKWLAFRSQARGGFESDKFRLMVLDREKKTIRELMGKAIPANGPLIGVPAFDLWIDEFSWKPDSRYLLFVSGEKGEAPIYIINVEGTDLHRLGKAQGEWSDVTQMPDNGIVGSLMRVDRPTEIAYVAPQDIDDTTRTLNVQLDHSENAARETTQPTVEPRWLTHLSRNLLSEIETSPLEPFWFTGAEGTKVEGFLIKPPGFDPAKKYPVKFLMHGGPQTAWGDAWSYRWNWELLAASGYVVVGINRRGSTGYGQKFVDEVSGDWGGRAYEDLMKGLDYAEATYPFIDKNRECALGASYGGFMADWVLTHTNRFKCIVTHDGMYDPVSAWGDTEEMWFNEWEFRRPEDFAKGWDGFNAGYDPMGHAADPTHRDKVAMNGAPRGSGGTKATTEILTGRQNDDGVGMGHPAEPWRYQNLPADQDPFRRWAPMRFIQNAKTPTLVVHSQRDMRLDVSQGMELFGALQRLGVPSKMLYFPDEGHWVLKPQNAQLWNEVVGDWCDRWTRTGKYAEGR